MFRLRPEKRSPWFILGISEFSKKSEIVAAFRKLSLLLHPDHHMKESKEAIERWTYEFSLISQARTQMIAKKPGWVSMEVRAGWRRPSVVDEFLRRGGLHEPLPGGVRSGGNMNNVAKAGGPGPTRDVGRTLKRSASSSAPWGPFEKLFSSNGRVGLCGVINMFVGTELILDRIT